MVVVVVVVRAVVPVEAVEVSGAKEVVVTGAVVVVVGPGVLAGAAPLVAVARAAVVAGADPSPEQAAARRIRVSSRKKGRRMAAFMIAGGYRSADANPEARGSGIRGGEPLRTAYP
jgi:hypothetical protein